MVCGDLGSDYKKGIRSLIEGALNKAMLRGTGWVDERESFDV